MKIIGIESASLVASAAIWEDEKLLAEYTIDYKKTHSQTLLPMLEEICRMTECEMNSVDAVAVSAGPGSFTGLRIGAATAKGLGLALNIPLIAVPTLDAQAFGLFGVKDLICPIMDARRGQVYTGIYRFDEEDRLTVIKPSCAADFEEIAEELKVLGGRVYFLGDGVPVFREKAVKLLGENARFVPAGQNRQRAALVASLGARMYAEGKTVSSGEFAPKYYRESQAERVKRERESAAVTHD